MQYKDFDKKLFEGHQNLCLYNSSIREYIIILHNAFILLEVEQRWRELKKRIKNENNKIYDFELSSFQREGRKMKITKSLILNFHFFDRIKK